jgi:hypothetical protein
MTVKIPTLVVVARLDVREVKSAQIVVAMADERALLWLLGQGGGMGLVLLVLHWFAFLQVLVLHLFCYQRGFPLLYE